MKKQKLPRGWTEKRIQKVIAHYDDQTEDEQAAEIDRAVKDENMTWIAVPTELVPKILKLVEPKRGA